MAVVIETDFIVGLTVKNKFVLDELFNLNGDIKFTISDCMKTKRRSMTNGYGNVIALSNEEDFRDFLYKWRDVFELQPDRSYKVNREVLYDENYPYNFNFSKLLTIGIYNGTHMDIFDYPRPLSHNPQPGNKID